jgi:uncharacterized repeat protein (TIGR02543 family)
LYWLQCFFKISNFSFMKKILSKIYLNKLITVLLLFVFVLACKKQVENPGIVTLCPIVASSDPMDHAIDVAYDKVITITFNEAMNPTTINNATLLVKQLSTASYISGKVATTDNPSVFTFTPDIPLLPFQNYTGTVKKEVANTFRTKMLADYIFSFTTIPKLSLTSLPTLGGATNGAGSFAQGSKVTITAIPATGYTFINWTDSVTTNIISTSPNYQYSIAGNRTLIANFKIIPVGNFSVYTSSSPAEGGTTIGTGAYVSNASIAIGATPNPGYTFVSWTENGAIRSLSSNYQINGLTFNRNFVANFAIVPLSQLSLSLSASPLSGGSTSGNGSYTPGTSVTAIAIPNTGYSFMNWTDLSSIGVVSTSPNYAFVLNASRSLLANFKINTYTITTTTLNGSVVNIPNQLNYEYGTSVQLTAFPNSGYTFTSWTGDVTDTTNPLSLTMTANKNITANYTAIPVGTYALNVISANGSVLKLPNQVSYTSGTSVVLTATPNSGYTFTSWSGDVSDTSSTITIVMNSNKNIRANYTQIPASNYSLNIIALNGTATKLPNQLSYLNGTNVQLTATPATGYTFTSWTGDATGSTNPLTVNMNTNKTITANFTLIPPNTFTLNTSAVNGSIAKSPDLLNYNSGATVQLTATPSAGYLFSSWSGDATGSTNPISVLMNANKNVTANFTPFIPSVTLGSIANFGAFGGNAGITNQGLHTIVNNGGIGTTAASTLITGFHDGLTADVYTETPLNVGNVTGGIFTAPPAPGTATSNTIANNALFDATTAYNSISPASKPGGADPGAGELGGLTLAPGIYKSASGTFKITNLDLVLDAQGNPNAEWIFQTAAGLTVGTPAGAKSISLIGGAQAKNVYWYVGSTAVINYAGGGTMVGTILANSGVTLSSPANSTTLTAQTVLNGRAISLISSVTMVNTVINNQ